MIRHIVFFRAADPADKEAVFQGLSLLATIPHHSHFEVGRNLAVDAISPDGPDFVVYGEFADEAQLAAYKAHPTYAEATRRVRPLRDMRIAADFQAKG
jgi:quinol monooxygenase YgiN